MAVAAVERIWACLSRILDENRNIHFCDKKYYYESQFELENMRITILHLLKLI